MHHYVNMLHFIIIKSDRQAIRNVSKGLCAFGLTLYICFDFFIAREILGRKRPEDGKVQQFVGKLQHWPRLQNQTLKNRAHVFRGHLSEITDIVADSSKILSCSLDGSIRLWSPSTGACMYTIDGFDNISSLCLEESLLVTDGMGQYVCVHDFDTIEDIDQTYDLDFGL